IIKVKQLKWFTEIGRLIVEQDNPSIKEVRVNPFTIHEEEKKKKMRGNWVITSQGLVGRLREVKKEVALIRHWKMEGNKIMRACTGCGEHMSSKTAKGVMKVEEKAIIVLTVHRKRKIYEKTEDIEKAFKLKKKEKYEILREALMTKSQKKSWKL
ncbi:25623_t:CDS:1, partial [Gigaspora rosea]